MKRDEGRRKGTWEMSRQSLGAMHGPRRGLRPALASQLWELNKEAHEEDGGGGQGTAPENLGTMTLVLRGLRSPSRQAGGTAGPLPSHPHPRPAHGLCASLMQKQK